MFFVLVIVGLLAPYISPYDPNQVSVVFQNQPPGWSHPMGADNLGRDVLSRVIWGARTSLEVGILSLVLFTIGAFAIGLPAGYYGGLVDDIVMRIVDIFLVFPSIILALAVIVVLGPGVVNLIFVLGIIYTPALARVVRASVLAEKAKAYVEAAKAGGDSDFHVMLEILPNALPPIIVQCTLFLAQSILSEAALSFLGLGIEAPGVAWGSMLSDAQGYLTSLPWTAVFPGLAIFIVVLGVNLFGDGLRDILDPRLRL